MSRKFFAMPWTFGIIASATSAFGIGNFGIRTGIDACWPKIGSTPNSVRRDSRTSALRRPSNTSISRVIRSWADRPSAGIASARSANDRRLRASSSSPARLASS